MEVYPCQDRPARNLTVDGGDYLTYDLGDLYPGDSGRVIEFTLRLKEICPERRVAAAVALTERDGQDQEHPRGIRTYLLPPHHEAGPRDVILRPVRFILPAELDVSANGARRLTVRVDAHYVDRNGSCSLTKL